MLSENTVLLHQAVVLVRTYLPLPDWPEWALDVLVVMSGLLIIAFLLSQLVPENTSDDDEEKEKGERGDQIPNPWLSRNQAQLRDELRKRSLSTSGLKAQLQQRLYEDDQRKLRNGTACLSISDTNGAHKSHEVLLGEFRAFRWEYITVYLVIMLADWMQGTHMYTLYLSYEVNISALFLTGFLSGAIFAPFLGSFVDKFGRKRSCIIYCVLEVIINVMEHYDNFTILIVGRVLGGISTNLLFSAFESWMTTEHRRKGYPESWLASTYSHCSIANGSTAILAGLVAQVLEDRLGHIGPFQGAIALTLLALFLVLRWEENYGEETQGDGDIHETSSSTLVGQFLDGWRTTISDSRIWRIGLTQALSEGAMYTFVFMWVPTLLKMNPVDGLPTGCVFSSLMMAITIGGLLFPALQAAVSIVVHKDAASELCAALVYFCAAASMIVPTYCIGNGDGTCFELVIASFLVVEFCVGLFMPVAGTLRSKYVPDALQGAILNIFRLPLNAIVVAGTYATDVYPTEVVYKFVSGSFALAALLQLTMISSASDRHTSTTLPSDKKRN